MIQLESMETNEITFETMPFLYRLSQKFAYVDNIISLPYTTWSTAGTLIMQSNIPQIISDMRFGTRMESLLTKYNILPSIPDYLKLLNYDLLYSCIGYDSIMGFYEWFRDHGYRRYSHPTSDISLFNYLKSCKFIETYNKKGETERFAHHIVTVDTHMPFRPKEGCLPENTKEPILRQNFNCLDQVLRNFITKYLELDMFRHTLLVVFPDHIQPGGFLPEPRRLFMLFPGMEKRPFRKNVTYHDFAPTIMEELGIIEYEPEFPFGSDVFTSDKFTYARPKDLSLIYDILVDKFNFQKISYYVCHTGAYGNQSSICDVTHQ